VRTALVTLAILALGCRRSDPPNVVASDAARPTNQQPAVVETPPAMPQAIATAENKTRGEHPGGCFVDEGRPAGGAIRPKLTASRVRGVAPLAVFFDTRGTTADVPGRPFRDLAYCFHFGDAKAGVFPATGRERNTATGPVAAHVYETPGTYRVTLSVRDGEGRSASTTVDVQVQDPATVFAGENTVCLSDNQDFQGCPAGARHLVGTNIAQSLGPELRPGRRLLLRRGGRFTGSLQLNVPGPGIIGAFGPMSAPKPQIAGGKETFAISGEEPKFSDWRLMDLDVTGTEATRAVGVGGRARDLSILRLRAVGLGGAVVASESIINFWNHNGSPGHDVIDGLAIQDSEFREVRGGEGHGLLGIAGRRFSLLGNVLRDSIGGEHVMRAFFLDRAVISNNDFGEAPKPRHLLKLHAGRFDRPGIGQGTYSQEIVISDNLFRGTGGHDWSVAIGPQNGNSDERIRDVIVERNLFSPGTGVHSALVLFASGVTVRDNVFDRGSSALCISGGRRGVEPVPSDITIVHNTCYSTATDPILAKFDVQVPGLRVFNNLVLGPHAATVQVRPEKAEQGGNVAVKANVASKIPANPLDFTPGASSPATDAALPGHASLWDHFRKQRPVDGNGDGKAAPDVGALERVP
jgi:PKD repeat protein